tara:strand:+ start:174 stop:410 length:237 start_codon:yes stop_codon:yes gene_type:complete
MLRLFLVTSAIAFVTACGSTRVVFVGSERTNDLIRVGPDVKGKAYVWDGKDWILSKNKIEYPEGAYVGFADDGKEPTE